MKQALKGLFERDLTRLYQEIEQYSTEDNLWIIDQNISNSAGNLCLHLLGNLKTYVGNGLGQINYIRDREFEFSGKNIPKTELLSQVNETKGIVLTAIESIDTSLEMFPFKIWAEPTSMNFTLIHLYGHFNYHLGQINYHRRLLDV